MSKQQYAQQYIYKFHSKRILKSPDCNLIITLAEAKSNNEVISLADSEILRMIDNLNGVDRKDTVEKIQNTKRKIKQLRKLDRSTTNTKLIRAEYGNLDKLQYKDDYVAIIMDNPDDMDRLNEGFQINGISYQRLIGTTNGVKKNTVIYAPVVNSNDIAMRDELTIRMDNGRNKDVKLVPAKFEAYRALTCSASIPVTNPKGILVVDDLIVTCRENIIKLDDTNDGEPSMIITTEPEEIETIDSDGYGLISLELSQQWATDSQVNYLPSGYCVRNSFCKGMVFTFDFKDFAEKIAKKIEVKDAWGNSHNINDIELILTTSMLKLWDSYNSIDDYMANCGENGYGFSVTKVCPQKLENERNMNYQFLQSYQLTDEEIAELIAPTVNEIKDVINGDVAKTILFLKGAMSTDDFSFENIDNVIQALMIDKNMANDPYIINRINYMIKKKINDAKIGVLKVHGNYAVISGDPYALCQHIFECEVENDEYGLLRAGQIYAKYWIDSKSPKIVCFRAPMSCHNNIKVMDVTCTDEMAYWYKYMPVINILNCHDTVTAAENGADKDGDCFITTDNPILLKNTKPTLTIMCSQKKADKIIVTEESLCKANKNGFGEEIGKITNRITAMYDVQAQFDKSSREYQDLEYRIMCGQLLQQNAIDKTKGIISKPMPKMWYDKFSVKSNKNDSNEVSKIKQYNSTILANKKPYFMCYIYPQDMAIYKGYVKNSEAKAQLLFGMTISELTELCDNSTNANELVEEKKYVEWYRKLMPYGLNNCVMNKICWKIEKEFDGFITDRKTTHPFDYKIMSQGLDYSNTDYHKLKLIYQNYMQEMSECAIKSNKYRIDKDDVQVQKSNILKRYKQECVSACPQGLVMCDILLDMCYRSEKSKKFVWDICGETIIENLLMQNDRLVTYYVSDDNGNIVYCGEKYSEKTKEVKV